MSVGQPHFSVQAPFIKRLAQVLAIQSGGVGMKLMAVLALVLLTALAVCKRRS